MVNAVTGDFEAVVQVSGLTINRLLATMHQNAFTDPTRPSFPHSVTMRLGDDHPVDGVRGRLEAQIGAPRIVLANGATDHFGLEVDIRAWYRGDPGTAAFPTYINGMVRAEYRIQDVDPHCRGWSNIAQDYFWVRVVEDSVEFHGTAVDDWTPFQPVASVVAGAGSAPTTPAENIAKVRKQVVGLLLRRFQATPHPVSKRFRKGSLRSLHKPIGGSAVVVPVGLTREPTGSLASVNDLFLDGSDVAIAVSIEYIMSLLNPTLRAVRSYDGQSVPVHISTDWPQPDIDTVYRISVDPPQIQWQPHGWYGVFNVKIHGSAKTDSVAADATFDVEQNVTLGFDSGAGTLSLTAGNLKVTANADGLYSGTVADAVRDNVYDTVKAIVDQAVKDIQQVLDSLTARILPDPSTPVDATQNVIGLLRSLDGQAGARLTDCVFRTEGVVLRGQIRLSPRRRPVVQWEMTAARDGFSALQSWIPGGRIDQFEWRWYWSNSQPADQATLNDRFVLHRPWGAVSRWGVQLRSAHSLPGIDGNGRLCLQVTGVQTDPVSGQLVPISSVWRCLRFGVFLDLFHTPQLFLRDVPELVQDVPFPQLAVVRAGGGNERSTATNVLVLYLEHLWDAVTASTLRGGLEACRRYDAGLLAVVLFKEGVLTTAGARALKSVDEFVAHLGVPRIVNEDVRGSWARALGFHGGSAQPQWRLVSPAGAVTWAPEGHVTADMLGKVLDTRLQPSPPATPVQMRDGLEIGVHVAPDALHPPSYDFFDPNCPPPLGPGRAGTRQSVVTFVQPGSLQTPHISQHSERSARSGEGPVNVVVVYGGSAETEPLMQALGPDVIIVPDPTGVIADRFNIGTWPTTVTIEPGGMVSAVEVGVLGLVQ